MLLILATLTILMAGMCAMVENDLKKIIALSTLSQLGVIIARIGLNLPKLAIFHLLTHALFKALLFLCAGSIIHLHHHRQDLREVGALSLQIPTTISCLIIANLALCGAPFLAGFYSKDIILELSLWAPVNLYILIILFAATALTTAYSIRFIIFIMWAPQNQPPIININDEDITIIIPILALTTGAVIRGRIIN
jgi:NADH-ubiquinone oxidoreductase chain 5